MVFGNLQGLPKLMGFLEGEDQESTQTGAELKGLGHEKHLHGRKPRIHIWRYGFQGVEMTDNQDWGMVEEPVYSLFIEICHLSNGECSISICNPRVSLIVIYCD